jgi:hypothetical protein
MLISYICLFKKICFWQYWGLNSHPYYHLSSACSPFCFGVIFLVRSPVFALGPASIRCPTYRSQVTVILGVRPIRGYDLYF